MGPVGSPPLAGENSQIVNDASTVGSRPNQTSQYTSLSTRERFAGSSSEFSSTFAPLMAWIASP
jgi:hypothetical protein